MISFPPNLLTSWPPNFLKGLAVFVVGVAGFLEDAEVGGIAALGYVLLFEGFEDGTTGFVSVGAVAEAASLGYAEYFGKIMTNLFRLELHCAEAAYTGSVDDLAAAREVEHLGECGGMHAGVVGGRYGAGAQAEARYECVDERGLAHARVARQQAGLARKEFAEAVHALAYGG